jgi:glycolate oxidase
MADPLLSSLAQLYPPARVLTQPAALAPYECDALTATRVRPRAVVLPETQQEVIDTVRLCYRLGVPFVARGSGTSLSGGSLPVADGIVHRPQPAQPHRRARSGRSAWPWSSRG